MVSNIEKIDRNAPLLLNPTLQTSWGAEREVRRRERGKERQIWELADRCCMWILCMKNSPSAIRRLVIRIHVVPEFLLLLISGFFFRGGKLKCCVGMWVWKHVLRRWWVEGLWLAADSMLLLKHSNSQQCFVLKQNRTKPLPSWNKHVCRPNDPLNHTFVIPDWKDQKLAKAVPLHLLKVTVHP